MKYQRYKKSPKRFEFNYERVQTSVILFSWRFLHWRYCSSIFRIKGYATWSDSVIEYFFADTVCWPLRLCKLTSTWGPLTSLHTTLVWSYFADAPVKLWYSAHAEQIHIHRSVTVHVVYWMVPWTCVRVILYHREQGTRYKPEGHIPYDCK